MIHGHSEPAFAPVVARFGRLFREARHGGGALCIMMDDEVVVDVWTGWRDARGTLPWYRDTMAMSFSTTKGVSSFVVHKLVDEGVLSYDEPIGTWWPEFKAQGKENMTLRDVMTHRAGLHSARRLSTSADDLLDHELMEDRLAASEPRFHPQGRSGYHAVTYGWLLGGVIRRASGKSLTDHVHDTLEVPLELDGLSIGADKHRRHRVAELHPKRNTGMDLEVIARRAGRLRRFRPAVDALLPAGFDELFLEDEPRMLDAEMGAVNGVFTARSLARLYSSLARGGMVGDERFLSEELVKQISQRQVYGRDYVIGIPMAWRLGFHHGWASGRVKVHGFGHYGFGGSGGWADPVRRMSLGFVTNRLAGFTTPMADARLGVLSGLAIKTADEVAGRS